MSISHLIAECATSLQQLNSALESTSDELYAREQEEIYHSSIGLHVRHVLDHYTMFFAGLPGRLVNYDERAREQRLETDREYALQKLDETLQQLQKMDDCDADLEVIMELQADSQTATRQRSSVARELAFLHSHATHHYATLAFIFKSLGLDFEGGDFGLAPATVRNRRGLQCAR